MSNTSEMTINRLPSITWNWLKMNEAHVGGVDIKNRGKVRSVIPAGVKEALLSSSTLDGAHTGMGPEMTRIVEESEVVTCHYFCDSDIKVKEPLRLEFAYDEGCSDVNSIDLIAGDDSELTVIMNFRSDASCSGEGSDRKAAGDKAAGTAGVQTRYHVGKNALLRIVQVQMLDDNFTFLNDIGGDCDENGRIEVIQVILSGGKTYIGTRANLTGKKSYFKADIGYVVKGDGRLDMNYVADQPGKKTESLINASGVLRDRAFKLFRGTIDFHRGCAGSVGNEKEDVLLIDDGVVNQTVPLILCDEEDVVGNHGATIGQIDDSLLFYLQTRGLDEEHIYEMMAQARIDAVSALIPDQKTREEIRGFQLRNS